jgi:hypothetical protein
MAEHLVGCGVVTVKKVSSPRRMTCGVIGKRLQPDGAAPHRERADRVGCPKGLTWRRRRAVGSDRSYCPENLANFFSICNFIKNQQVVNGFSTDVAWAAWM